MYYFNSNLNRYFHSIRKYPIHSDVENKELGKILYSHKKNSTEYKQALDKLVTGNVRLVISLARKYANRHNLVNDMIQSGNEGLVVAAHAYDYRKGPFGR